MKNIKDDSWKEWHKLWMKDAPKMLGKDKLTVDEQRIAYFAWRDAVDMCNAEMEAQH